MVRKILPGLTLALALLAGCAADELSKAPSTQPHAECTVCKMNVDLACIDVAVDDKTPKLMYQGKTYYFCSDECKAKFEKNPATYAK
jgi:YHS domain-containing protein